MSVITLPEAFRERYAEAFGSAELSLLEQAIQSPLSPSIRLHPYKGFTPRLRDVPWCKLGRFTDEEMTLGADPLWHAGAYYAQEPASMFVAQYIEQLDLRPATVLDLCAAPGGKSSLLRSYIPSDSLLVANEIDSARSKILLENLTRFGLDETIVTSATPQKLAESGVTFELILVDAPCSGEGMFRKEPKAIAEWSEENVALCVTRQREILDAAWLMLEEGGVLIYSTCTYNREENEEQLAYLMSSYNTEILQLKVDTDWGIKECTQGVYRFAPHHTESEGLSIFAVRKVEAGRKIPLGKKGKMVKAPAIIANSLDPDLLYTHNETWHSLSNRGQDFLRCMKGVKILAGGVALGVAKGKDFIPHHAWASSCKTGASMPYKRIELSLEAALRFLKREPIEIEGEKGFYCVTYKHIPLGFAKHIGNRSNNLYPKELAIRNNKLSVDNVPNWM